MATIMDGRSLVESLTVDFSLEGKKTCRDCLRSKAIPCERVLTLTTSYQLLESSILEAHSLIMQNLLDMSSHESLSGSSLSHINTTATAIRFAQLLLYLPSARVLKAKQDQSLSHQTSMAQETHKPGSAVGPSDAADKAIHSLFENMVKSVLKVLEGSQTMEIGSDPMMLDASTTQGDARPLMCFCFQSILRLHQFCKRKQQWMIPLTKALCDLATACQKRDVPLPISLLEDAIRTITNRLEEGTIIVANHMASTGVGFPAGQHTFFAKFLSFLVARVVTLVLFLPDHCSDKEVSISPLWKILITLRGMPVLILAADVQKSSTNKTMVEFLRSFSEISCKIEKQMLKVLLREAKSEGESTTFHIPFLQTLCEMKIKPAVQKTFNNNPAQWIMRNSRILGRMQMLHAVIQKVALDTTGQLTSADADVLLKVCETYFFIVLPHCFGILAASMYSTSTQLPSSSSNALCLEDCISSMAKLLIRIERTLGLHDANKRSQLYRLLIRWMSPTNNREREESGVSVHHENKMHPITQEFVLSVIYVYILSHGGTMPPLVSLMVKILFDNRTNTMLRSNITCVLVRLQISPKVGEWKHDVSRLIESEFVAMWKVYSVTCGRRNASDRKRKRNGASGNIVPIHHYISNDVEVIGQVLAQLSTHGSPLLTRTIETMIDDHAWKRIGEKKKGIHLKAISLLLWYTQGTFSTTSSPALSDERRKSLLRGLLDYGISQLTVNAPKRGQDFLDHGPLFLATLSLCHKMIDNAKQLAIVLFPAMCQFMAVCTSKSFLQPVQVGCMRDNYQWALLNRRLLLEGLSLLGSVAPVITVSCPNQLLEMVRETFIRAFENHDMNILSPTLSALIRFGQTIATPHARSLPRFLPKDRMPLFQARGQGMIWKNGAHFGIDNGIGTFLELCSGLEHLVQQRNVEKSIFPALSTYHIAIGSYFLQMPTQGGRQAIVIFPPGEQSLNDIRHMYELQDGDELTQVQSLKRIVVSNLDREGYQFLLSKEM